MQPDFNPELGFVRRTNTPPLRRRRILAAAAAQQHAGQELRPGVSAPIAYLDPLAGVETREQTMRAGIAFQDSSTFSFNVTNTFDRLVAPFAIQRTVIIPPGDYSYRRYSVGYSSNRGRGPQRERQSQRRRVLGWPELVGRGRR